MMGISSPRPEAAIPMPSGLSCSATTAACTGSPVGSPGATLKRRMWSGELSPGLHPPRHLPSRGAPVDMADPDRPERGPWAGAAPARDDRTQHVGPGQRWPGPDLDVSAVFTLTGPGGRGG